VIPTAGHDDWFKLTQLTVVSEMVPKNGDSLPLRAGGVGGLNGESRQIDGAECLISLRGDVDG